MIFFAFLFLFLCLPAQAQEAAGEDTSGMRLTRESPTKYVPSVPAPEDNIPQASEPQPEIKIVPLDSPSLYIDNTRLLTFTILNKQTARMERLEVTEGGSVTYGTLTIRLIECWHSAPDAKPDSAALLKIFEGTSRPPSYFGWMWSSTPSLNPFEHASYDISVKECR